jgi:predicted metal-dependent hydrolase
MTPTLCQPCGRHKDRCRCAGRRKAYAEAATWLADEAREARRTGETAEAAELASASEHFRGLYFRALANGAP